MNRTGFPGDCFSVSSGDGGNPSPSGEEKIVDVPEGDDDGTAADSE